MKQCKILITGAGISGLSAAIALEKNGVSCRIIEKKESFENRGYAVALQGEGIIAAASLGILERVRETGVKRIVERIERCNGSIITSHPPESAGEGFTISRNSLHTILREKAPPVEFNLSIINITCMDGKNLVRFSDKTTDSFDIILGADGINSKLRERINTEECIRPAGLAVWNIRVKDYFPIIREVWSRNRIVAFYPLKGGLSISFFVKVPFDSITESGDRKSDIRSYFKVCGNKELNFALNNSEADIFFGSVRNVQTPVWFDKGILLIGDAAHGVSPLSGMGANLAMGDAVAFAGILSKIITTTGKNWQKELGKEILKRKKEADKACRTGEMRKKRALGRAPFSWIRDYTIHSGSWSY